MAGAARVLPAATMRTATVLLVAVSCSLASPPADAAEPELRVLRATKIYPAPDAAAIDDGVVLLRGDRIVAVGRRDEQSDRLPALAPACDGGVVVAGFQNSHVHLIGPAFENARTAQAGALSAALTRMLTRHGFTTVVDIASDRDDTLALRERIERGEVRGPRILTAGLPLFPPAGLPSYMDGMSPALLAKLPQPETVASALAVVRRNLDAGADATKLFLVTPQRGRGTKAMPRDIAGAAADETHRRGKLVFAHPTDFDGLRAALHAKVDILAHPPLGIPGPWPRDLLDALVDSGVHLVPTLKLLKQELAKDRVPADVAGRIVADSVHEFGRFAAAGGRVLFGTDVGYIGDDDPADEYELMSRAGMSATRILASLTTTPAERWNEDGRRGRVAPGMDADLVVLDADPMRSPKAFAGVRCTVRGGEVVHAR